MAFVLFVYPRSWPSRRELLFCGYYLPYYICVRLTAVKSLFLCNTIFGKRDLTTSG